MALIVENLAFGYGRRNIAQNISFNLNPGEVLCLLGPNGVGKTTLFKALLGLIRPVSGSIVIDGVPLSQLNAKMRARKLAYVPQGHATTFPFSVIDIVLMGRAAHLGPLAIPGHADHLLAYQCLARLGMEHLAKRSFSEISGGERQSVLIARALMQEARVIIMDEPTASLDYGNQVRVLALVRQLADDGISVLFSSHAPDHAFLCADRVALMSRGRLGPVGRPGDVLTASSLKALYRIDVTVGTLAGHPTPLCAPVMPVHGASADVNINIHSSGEHDGTRE